MAHDVAHDDTINTIFNVQKCYLKNSFL